jgi:hypothetical protein
MENQKSEPGIVKITDPVAQHRFRIEQKESLLGCFPSHQESELSDWDLDDGAEFVFSRQNRNIPITNDLRQLAQEILSE